ncbi:uncharacterized protein LOC133806300 [Humulus lupulus]|uniref:uncharacterized protein LOC133806300 n=1 Tax=Humulus lupulus TaxID=3486 RepID=UPI002B40A8CD|nr:uncharacterized protein LOC133806300 [Humulus lupulus]
MCLLDFELQRAIISDEGTHFMNKLLAGLLAKYSVKHMVATAYHRQTNGHAELSKREINHVFKKVVNPICKDCSNRLVFGKALKTPLSMSPYRLVFGKACHFPIELEHRTYWALQQRILNF